MTNIGIIGGGAWGTALAQVWAQKGHHVILWARRDFVVERVNDLRVSSALPGVTLHDGITATTALDDLHDADILIYVLPAQELRGFLDAFKPTPGTPFVIAAKGIEIASGLLPADVAEECIPGLHTAILTGPNFAREVAIGLPAAATLACRTPPIRAQLLDTLSTPTYRLYGSTDVTGASVGGALKNVLAIACGIVDGLKLGDNARAAVVTRGLAEIARLSVAMGGSRETLMGLSGIGDILLSCTSTQSRNYRYGLALADGDVHNLHDDTTVEGIHTANAILPLIGRLGIEMPIAVGVAACLNGQLSVEAAVQALLQRPTRENEYE
jgi:glycerol-3-phosphate dehydrogenase (NAD(P)+)